MTQFAKLNFMAFDIPNVNVIFSLSKLHMSYRKSNFYNKQMVSQFDALTKGTLLSPAKSEVINLEKPNKNI